MLYNLNFAHSLVLDSVMLIVHACFWLNFLSWYKFGAANIFRIFFQLFFTICQSLIQIEDQKNDFGSFSFFSWIKLLHCFNKYNLQHKNCFEMLDVEQVYIFVV